MAEVYDRRLRTTRRLFGSKLQAAFLDNNVSLLPGQRVDVVSPEGTFGTVDGMELEQSLRQQGFRVAEREEATRARASRQTGQAFVEGVARGATAGLSDRILDAARFTREEYPGEAELARTEREAQSPVAAGLGQAAGIVGSLAVPASPAALAARAGVAVERAAGGVIGSRLARLAAGTAAEGGVYSAAHALAQEDLGDPERTAERVLADVGVGTLLGGGIGVAIGAPAAIFRGLRGLRAGRQATEQLLTRAVGETPPSLLTRGMDNVRRTLGRLARRGGPAEDDFLRQLSAPGAAGREFRQRLIGKQEVRERVSREMADMLNESEKITTQVSRQGVGELKRAQVAQVIRRGEYAEVRESVEETLQRFRTSLDEMAENVDEFDSAIVRPARRAVEGTSRRLQEAERAGRDTITDAFMELDSLKRNLAPLARYGRNLSTLTPKAANAAQRVDNLYGGLRSQLESEALWGEAGRLQARVNEAWTTHLGGTGAKAQQQFMVRVGYEHGRPVHTVDPGKVNTYLRSMSKPGNDLRHQALVARLDSQENLVNAMARHHKLSPQAAQLAERLGANNTQLRSTIRDMEETVAAQNLFEEFLTAEKEQLFSPLTKVAGGLAFGPAGAIAGVAAGAATSPVRSIVGLHRLESSASSAMARLRQAVRKAVRPLEKIPRPSRSLITLPTQRMLLKKDRDAYRQKADELSAYVANPGALIRQTEESLQEVAQDAPDVAAQAGVVAGRAVSYLQSILPAPTVSSSNLLTGNRQLPLSDLELSQFARSLQAVEDPLSIAEDLAEGRLNMDAMRAIQAVYPRLYEDMGNAVMEEMLEARADGVEVPYQNRLVLGLAFDVPTDHSLEPEHAQAIGAVAEQLSAAEAQVEQAKEQARIRPSQVSVSSAIKQPGMSESNRIAYRRAD